MDVDSQHEEGEGVEKTKTSEGSRTEGKPREQPDWTHLPKDTHEHMERRLHTRIATGWLFLNQIVAVFAFRSKAPRCHFKADGNRQAVVLPRSLALSIYSGMMN